MNVTTKQQATDRYNIRTGERFMSALKELESLIVNWSPGMHISFDVNTHLPDVKPNERVVIEQTLMAMYEASGWTVKRNDSQRDGSWIELS